MQTICFYILTAYSRNSAFSTEAGLKYFIIGSFISGCLLLGIVLIYSYLGTADLQDINNLLLTGLNRKSGCGIVGIGIGLITFTLLFKLACYPFHY
jgi:NADH-quinone oxidoreductase subunit N